MKKLLAMTIAAVLLLAACAPAAVIDRVPADTAMIEDAPLPNAIGLDAEAMTVPEAEQSGTFEMFSTVDINGDSVDESMLADSKLTVVMLWATYCQPCVRELPALDALADEYADRGVQVMGMVRDAASRDGEAYDDQVALANDIVDQLDVSFPQLLPSKELNEGALAGYPYTPTMLFLDSSGSLTGSPIVGYADYERLAGEVEGLLSIIDIQAEEDACPSCG